MMRSFRSPSVLAALVLAVVAVTWASPVASEAASVGQAAPAAPSAPAAEQRAQAEVSGVAQQYNICGAACAAPHPANAVAVAAFVSNADSALSISLNEVCFSQYQDILAATGTGNGAFVVARANVPNCPGTNKSFGNAVIVRFPISDSGGWTLSNPGRDCTNPSTECRAMVCASGVSAGGPVGSCSAHFIHSDDSIAQQQAAEYALIGVAVTPERRLLAGDFNLEPNQLPAIYAGAENITCDAAYCPTIPAAAPTRMIDFVFATPSPLQAALGPGCFDWASDHCLIRGQARWQD